MKGKNQQNLGGADGEGMKQPSHSKCHFLGAQKFGEGMEEKGRDAAEKTPLAGQRQQERCREDRKDKTEIVKRRGGKREQGLCQEQTETSRERGLGREAVLV